MRSSRGSTGNVFRHTLKGDFWNRAARQRNDARGYYCSCGLRDVRYTFCDASELATCPNEALGRVSSSVAQTSLHRNTSVRLWCAVRCHPMCMPNWRGSTTTPGARLVEISMCAAPFSRRNHYWSAVFLFFRTSGFPTGSAREPLGIASPRFCRPSQDRVHCNVNVAAAPSSISTDH